MMNLITYRAMEHSDILRFSASGDFSYEEVRKALYFFFTEPVKKMGLVFDIRDGLSPFPPDDIVALGKLIRDSGCTHVAFAVISFPEIIDQVEARYAKFPDLVQGIVEARAGVFVREFEAYRWVNQQINTFG